MTKRKRKELGYDINTGEEINMYTTKCTWVGREYGCRVFYNGRLVVEGRCSDKIFIGPTFRDLFRTLDKVSGDRFTSASRKRKYKDGNLCVYAKHYWGGKIDKGAHDQT